MDCKLDQAIDIGGFDSFTIGKSLHDCAVLGVDDPASDGATIRKLLAEHNLRFPK